MRLAVRHLRRQQPVRGLEDRRCYIVAHGSGHRRAGGLRLRQNSDVPISLAVAASSALPMIYKPVRIGGREYVDGGMRGNASLDIAIEHGADLIVCVNPLVPSTTAAGPAVVRRSRSASAASRPSRRRSRGSPRMPVCAIRSSNCAASIPEVDIILIEPHADDQMLAFGNIMRYCGAAGNRPPRVRVGDAGPGGGLRAATRRSWRATASRCRAGW